MSLVRNGRSVDLETRAGEPAEHLPIGQDATLQQIRLRDVCKDLWVEAAAGFSLLVQIVYAVNFVDGRLLNRGDQVDYRSLGFSFAQYWSTPSSRMQTLLPGVLRTPGYPLFLFANHLLHLPDLAVQLEQAALLTAAGVALAFLSAKVGGMWAGRAAMLLYAAYLPLLSYSSLFLSEALSISLAIFAVVCCHEFINSKPGTGWRWCALAAAFGTLAAIVRPFFFFSLIVLLGACLLSRQNVRDLTSVAALYLACFALVFGPWIGRNRVLEGSASVLGRGGPYGMALGVHLPIDHDNGALGAYRRSVRFWSSQRQDGFGPAQAKRMDSRATLRTNLTRHPVEFLMSRLELQYQLWAWPAPARGVYGLNERFVPYWALMALHLLILAGGLAGLWLLRRTTTGRLLGALVAITPVPYVLYYPEPRYALSAVPLLIVALAAAGPRMPLLSARAEKRDGRVFLPVSNGEANLEPYPAQSILNDQSH
jgi:hypothetical protein